MRKLFFVGMVLAGLLCGTSVVLAKEDGTEECCPIPTTCLEQARGVVELGENFLQTLQEGCVEMEEVKEVIILIITPLITPHPTQTPYPILAESKEEYDEAVHNFFGRSSRPKLKKD